MINLMDVLNFDGFEKRMEEPVSFDHFNVSGQTYQIIDKTPVNLHLTCTGERQVEIAGRFTATLIIPCDRCTKDVSYTMSFDFQKEISLNETNEDRLKNLDEANYIKGTILDLDTFIYDEMIMHFPMKMLCNESCLGVCLQCGTNLNKGKCNCEPTLDPRMAAIKDIFSNFKEV